MAQNIIIGAPCTPSEYVKREIITCYKVTMTSGGGIGGAQWDELLTENIPLGNEQIVEMKDVFGEVKRINTRYAVTSKEIKVVHDVYDISANVNYREEKYKYIIEHRWFKVSADSNLHFSDDYVCGTPKPFKTDYDKEEL